MLVFDERRNRSTRRKPLGTVWRTNKLTPGNRTWATLVGGECSPHCAIPAPLFLFKTRPQTLQKFYPNRYQYVTRNKGIQHLLAKCPEKNGPHSSYSLIFCYRWRCLNFKPPLTSRSNSPE